VALEQPVRVLFLFDHLGYPNGAVHGLTRYCLDVLPRVNADGVEVIACFLRDEHPAAEKLVSAGIRPVFLRRAKWDPRAVLDVVDLVRRHGVHVIHAAGHKGILAGRIAARVTGCASIVHLHDLYRAPGAIRASLRASARWSDAAFGVSEAVCRFAESEYRIPRSRIEVLRNGVHGEAFAPPEPSQVLAWRRGAGIADTARTIGIVGRLSQGKGHARLLRQMPGVLERVPAAELVVVGDGPLRDPLLRLAQELGVDRATRFVGYQEAMATVLAALEVVAIPSDHEGMPYAALEAMSASRPVVASRGGGLPEVVRHGETGLLFDLPEVDALGDAVVALLDEPARAAAMGEAGRRFAATFSIDRHVEQLRSAYLRLGRPVLARRSPR